MFIKMSVDVGNGMTWKTNSTRVYYIREHRTLLRHGAGIFDEENDEDDYEDDDADDEWEDVKEGKKERGDDEIKERGGSWQESSTEKLVELAGR